MGLVPHYVLPELWCWLFLIMCLAISSMKCLGDDRMACKLLLNDVLNSKASGVSCFLLPQ